MKRHDTFDAIVIGAGVVGNAAALALAREGLHVAIVEAHAPTSWQAQSPDLRVYAFASDSQALLQSLEVWPHVVSARVQPYRCMRIWDAAGGGELCFAAEQLGRYLLGHIVEHGLLVDRLWSAVLKQSEIERYCPDRLCAIEQNQEEATLTLESGKRLRARLVVGADGAASRVRELAKIPISEHDYHQRGIVAYVRTEKPHEDTCWQRFMPSGSLAFLPCSDGRSSIVWALPEHEATRSLALDDAVFCRELTRAFDARLGIISDVSQRAAFPLRRQLAKTMIAGRIALIGDAAHAVHPLAGQGVNLGLRDVATLREMVRAAKTSGHDFMATHRLARWARHRLSENTVSAYAFEAINHAFSNDALLPTLLRGHVLGLANKLPLAKQFLLNQAAPINSFVS